MERLRQFASSRLLPDLTRTVDRRRRWFRFILQLLALAFAIVSLARPRWGYTFEEARRRGIDLLIAVDTSRSMLSNDVQPNRLQRVKLAIQDLVDQLEGDRVGLIAFAGRAFVQAPLTIDYGAVIEAVRDLNTQTIPQGGTNIADAISLAMKTYGTSATGNRAMIFFTDGEELSGDAVASAKEAANQGIKVFTVGVGTSQGSLIPITSEDSQSTFVKDAKGQVVKSKLDEKRLREIAEVTGGNYYHLESGPHTAQQIISEGIGKMKAGDIDVRLDRRPIERFEWPLAIALTFFGASFLIGERRRVTKTGQATPAKATLATAALILLALPAHGAAPGLEAYSGGRFEDAYQQFSQTLQDHPQTPAADRLHFDAGAAAYKLKDYGKALQSFSQALLSKDQQLQSKTHYNLGNTLYGQGEREQGDEKKLSNWNNAIQHYDQALKINPQDQQAKDNREFVQNKIEDLKKKQSQPKPSPSPKQNQKDKNDKNDKKDKSQQQQDKNQQQQQKQDDQQQQQQQDQQQQQSSSSQGGQQQDQQQKQQPEQNGKDEKEQKDSSGADQKQQDQKEQKENGHSPAPSPSASPSATSSPQPGGGSPSPSPSASSSPTPGNDQKENERGEGNEPTPTPGENGEEQPKDNNRNSGSTGQSGQAPSPSPAPQSSPPKKFSGEIKGSNEPQPGQSPANAEAAMAEEEKDGQMSQRQAMALLQSVQDEEARVPLDERRTVRPVYNDW